MKDQFIMDRMQDELSIRGLAAATMKAYLDDVNGFLRRRRSYCEPVGSAQPVTRSSK